MFADIQIVTPPAEEPVTLEEFKAHARIDDPADDADLTLKLIAARQRCESYTRRSLITQTIDVWWDVPDGIGILLLPRGVVQSVSSLEFTEPFSGTVTADPSTYAIHGNAITFSAFPPPYGVQRGIKARLISGYGPDPEDVPAPLRAGILEYATHLYENRLGEAPLTKYEAEAKQGGSLPAGVADKWASLRLTYV